MSQTTSDAPPSLPQRRAALLADQPSLRARDAAASLGISEAEWVATGDSTPLAPDWAGILAAVPGLGEVMALTRNESAVHEKTGQYGVIQASGSMGLILGEPIDLRLFFSRWRHGFAVAENGSRGPRNSLQFFDPHGVAVHKIYLTGQSDVSAYQALAERFAGHAAPLEIQPLPPPKPAQADPSIDAGSLCSDWDALQDTHDFHAMLSRHRVTRTQALRLAGPRRARSVGAGSLRTVLEGAASKAVDIMVFVGNAGTIQIHTGPVTRLKATGPWFNVLDEGFNLHLREDRIDAAWVVTKPTADGPVTSLELFDDAGNQIATLFGRRKPGQAEDPSWQRLVQALA